MKEYTNGIDIGDAIRAGRKDTICWDCKRACEGSCSWSDMERHQPVEGWTAEKTSMGYCVHDCPLFIRETWAAGNYRTAEDYILALETMLDNERTKLNRAKKYVAVTRNTYLKLKGQYKALQDKYKELLWHLRVHMGE